MNDLTHNGFGGGSPATMTSKDVADLCNKRHDNVRRTIETLAETGVITLPQIEEVPNSGPGPRAVSVYVFKGEQGKRDSIVVIAQLSPEFTAALVDRWQALESAVVSVDPMRALNDPATMRGLLLSYSDRVIALESANAAMAPQVTAFNRLAGTEGSFCMTDAAKLLQMRRIDLERELHARDWIYRRPTSGKWLGKSPKEQQGLLTHKMSSGFKPDGTEWSDKQVRITPKGLAKLAILFGIELDDAA